MVWIFCNLLGYLILIGYICWRNINQLTLFIMAVTRNNLSMKMKGRVGSYSFYTTTGGRQVARIANNSSNYGDSAKRTVAMQTRRTKWGNLVTFYRLNRDLMARAFESKDANISDYNRFMQLNIPLSRVSLTKDAFMRGVCILQEYVISDGSLPGFIPVVEEGGQITWNLKSSLDGEFADFTIGQVSDDLLKNNPTLQKGDQLTFVSWTNAGNVDSLPRLYRHLCEVTIDPASSISFGTLTSSNIVGATAGSVQILGQGLVHGQVIILSRVVSGQLLVSRSTIALSNDTFVQQFSAPDAVKEAIDSYGVDSVKLLEPGSDEQPSVKPIPALAKISSIITPPECATFKIRDNTTEQLYDNEASLPIGSVVALNINPAPGWNTTMTPEVDDPGEYTLTGDITFTITGTRSE